MSHSTKRVLSTTAIVIASVTFGVLVSADLGMVQKSIAQTAGLQAPATQGAVTGVTVPSFADVASRVMPAVVSVTSTEVVKTDPLRRRGMDPFDFFFPNPHDPRRRPQDDDEERRAVSGGSGFIISPDGYILTNNHVIEGASKVEVHYGADENGNGGLTAAAKIVGRDPSTDIALLKIETTRQLPYVPLGDSDRIRRGDWAIAVGNPLQFENSLTVGVISAKGRSLGLSEQTRSFENFIQTDAAINRGNSGGPLLNISGEVVGINTAIAGGAQGLGFATPINTAKRLLPQLKQGKVTRGYLGMGIDEVNERTKEAFGLPEARGAIVQQVEAGKPADKAGVQHGDVIMDVDGRPIRNNRDLIDYISYLPVGTSVKLGIIRNGQRMTLTAKTAERPLEGDETEEEGSNPTQPAHNRLGLSIQEMTPALRSLYSIPEAIAGVVVTNVKDVSAAGEANITEGDVISEVQGQRVTTVDQFRRAVEGFKSGQWIRMYVTTPPGRTGGRPFSSYRTLQVPEDRFLTSVPLWSHTKEARTPHTIRAVTDEQYMRRALELAERGRYSVSPNPMVGCVIVRDDAVIAEGWHQRAGEPHAEINALAQCPDANGATMYLTLEPCSHHGRTPPCCDQVIAAGVKRVVVAMRDPNSLVDGRGIEALRQAHIRVEVGVLEPQARRLNEKFVWWASQKLPFVLVKAAMTFDGKLATITRESQWITSDAARERSLALREEYDGVVIGAGTLAADNPRLTRRLGYNTASVPWTRVVLDGGGAVSPHAQLFSDGGHTILFTPKAPADLPRHVEVVEMTSDERRLDLEHVLRELHARGLQSVIVEGGSLLHSDFIRRGLWQKMIAFVAPAIVGGSDAPAIFSGEAVSRLTDAYRFRFDRVELVGTDLMITAYPG